MSVQTRRATVGMDIPSTGDVEGELANGDGHAVNTEVTETEDTGTWPTVGSMQGLQERTDSPSVTTEMRASFMRGQLRRILPMLPLSFNEMNCTRTRATR